MKKKLYIGKSIGAFLVVLLLMPLGHAMMALMEHFLATETLSRRFSNLQGGIRVGIRNSSIVTFMEWNVMMWGIYLLLMFCYDPVFLGQDHPVTIILALVSFVSSILMLKKELHIAAWGRNIRYALATVIVFWTFVEIMARNGFFNEIWVDPMNHIREMTIILAVFIIVVVFTIISSKYITTEE
jgi:hypothetical protein